MSSSTSAFDAIHKRPLPLTIDLCLIRHHIPIELCSIIKEYTHKWSGITNRNIHYLVLDYCVFEEDALMEYGLLPYWNTSQVTDMSRLFYEVVDDDIDGDGYDDNPQSNIFSDFNLPIELWDVSNVITMKEMFRNCCEFNQPLNGWDVRNVQDMSRMFQGASVFNQPLDAWQLDSLHKKTCMFEGADVYNQREDCEICLS